tara:strand:+ start:37 stop:1155 length:1119 start_codon:yes stop_codon:yes gene_type:complete
MNKIAVKLLLVGVLAFSHVEKANAICLDYWLKGPSACKEDPEEKNRILIKGGNVNLNVEKDEARIQYEQDLNVKIDKFLAGYGKPPREFVAFHLDPTLENAVRWVKKFNEEHERTMKIAVAWKQADRLFRQYKATGEILLPADSGVSPSQLKYLKEAFEEEASDLPKVKGFGVDLPGNWDEDRLSRDYAKLDYKDADLAQAASKLANKGEKADYALTNLERRIKVNEAKKQELEAMVEGKAKEEAKKATKKEEKSNKKEKLEISYYFSATCPYCTKFKPELKDAIEKYGKDNVQLTCVDMTPNGKRSPSNVKGKIDCKWRQLIPGETSRYGVSKTPTLLVKRGSSNGLELLENFHTSKALLDYFENGGIPRR